jgi:magnesium transporter
MVSRYTQKNLTWIDLVAPTPEEVRALMHEFGFNPLIAQELLSVSVKSKVERYDDVLYAVLHFPILRGTRIKRTTQEVDLIIGKEFLITTRYENITPLSSFAKAFEADMVLGLTGSHLHGGHLFAAILRNLYRALLFECDAIKTKLVEIEEVLFDGNEKDLVVEISQIGRVIYDFRQALLPHEEMLKSLEAPLSRMFGHEYSYYMHSVAAEYERVRIETDALRDSMQELRETNNSMLNAKQNEVMKNFSVMAIVFVPVSLIMGLYQMNLPHTPFAGQIDFWVLLAAIMVVSLALIIYFKRKGWL